MKVLIAGGAGYVGTSLSNYLANVGYDITVVDHFWFGDYLSRVVNKQHRSIMSLTPRDLKGFDAVVFLGGLSNDPMANFDPLGNFIENGAAPSYLAYVCKKAGVKRFVFASSCSVYGFTDGIEMDETVQVSPQYPYGISKVQAEEAIMLLEDDSFKPICLRKGTIGGWSERMRFDLVINAMTKSALKEGKITVNNPNIWRPLLEIRDAVAAYESAINSDSSASGIFNLSYGNYQIIDIGTGVQRELLNRGYSVELEVNNIHDVRNYKVSNEKFISTFNLAPEHDPLSSVGEILDHVTTTEFDLDNERWYNIQTFMKLKNSRRGPSRE